VPTPRTLPRVLTIAASDSGAGAGIQADLKAFVRAGVYGMTAITAVTAQNTRAVTAIHALPPAIVRAQIEAVLDDIGVDAVKIGMLASAEIAETVASVLRARLDAAIPLVIDPVLRASTGAALLEPTALEVLITQLLPRATVLTPNLPEARALLEHAAAAAPPPPPAGDAELARALLTLGPQSVVLTGGHRAQPGDIYVDAAATVELPGEHYPAAATHGSGCTHSALLTALLACGATPLEAARNAATLTAGAIRDALSTIGQGEGPVDVIGRPA
jgi:hydroxymethylpyrimidine/phosphomethylpyrimidine kinase